MRSPEESQQQRACIKKSKWPNFPEEQDGQFWCARKSHLCVSGARARPPSLCNLRLRARKRRGAHRTDNTTAALKNAIAASESVKYAALDRI